MSGKTVPNSMKQGRLLLDPEPLTEMPEPPHIFDEYSREAWLDLAGKLIDHKILTVFDIPLLRNYAMIKGLMNRLELLMNDEDNFELLPEPGKLARMNPFIKQYQDLSKHLLAMSDHFGLSPKSRGKVGMRSPTKEKESDRLQGFLDGKSKEATADIDLD